MKLWFQLLFTRSRYGFDRHGYVVTFVRSKTVGDVMHVLERGEFDVNNLRAWALFRDLPRGLVIR